MNDIKQLWQSQERETQMITLADIQSRATRFRGRIRWRNILVGGYSLFTVLVLGRWLWRHPQTEVAAAVLPMVLLALAAHLWILFALWWRGRARALPDDLAGGAALDFLRHELEQQRRAAATAWAWYILPFVPGGLMSLWLVARHDVPNLPAQMLPLVIVTDLLFFLAIWLAFNWHASRLSLELERLKSLRA